jgi:coenzyme F420-0:L-glutamate ligase/coenzyme F420-1:gamma-L-glutamate ligase
MEEPILLVENLNGHISIHAGIDDSNVEDGYFARLPDDPDASARGIASKITELTGRKVSVILTDTNGRAFKKGQTGVAVGLSGLDVILDWRGQRDLFARELKIAEEAVCDELASAANLLMGEGGDGCPVVVIRGLDLYTDEHCSVKQMYRSSDEDVIRKGLVCLKQSGKR